MEKLLAEQLFELFEQYIIIDLRDTHNFEIYRIPYSHAYSECQAYISELHKKICFVCGDGKKSQEMILQYPSATYLDGGLLEWIQHNFDETLLKKYSVRELCEGQCCKR